MPDNEELSQAESDAEVEAHSIDELDEGRQINYSVNYGCS